MQCNDSQLLLIPNGNSLYRFQRNLKGQTRMRFGIISMGNFVNCTITSHYLNYIYFDYPLSDRNALKCEIELEILFHFVFLVAYSVHLKIDCRKFKVNCFIVHCAMWFNYNFPVCVCNGWTWNSFLFSLYFTFCFERCATTVCC